VLRTPPDIATNGAIVLAAPGGAGAAGKTLVAGVRPSLDLGFSPIAFTADLGRSWAAGLGVVLTGNRAATLAGPGGSWRRLPALPCGRTVTLALPGGGGTDALAADGGTLTVWRLGASWAKTQTVQVPIQYGSSG